MKFLMTLFLGIVPFFAASANYMSLTYTYSNGSADCIFAEEEVLCNVKLEGAPNSRALYSFDKSKKLVLTFEQSKSKKRITQNVLKGWPLTAVSDEIKTINNFKCQQVGWDKDGFKFNYCLTFKNNTP